MMNGRERTIGVVLLIIFLILGLFSTPLWAYKLKLLNKFTIPELPTTDDPRMNGYGVGYAISDSLIYFIDVTDSTVATGFCYNYAGVKQDNFKLTANTGYVLPLTNADCLNYLTHSQQLAYIDIDKFRTDFYNLKGDFIKSTPLEVPSQANFLEMAEFNGNRYYITISYVRIKAALDSTLVTSYIKLYEEQHNQPMQVIRNIEIVQHDYKRGINWKVLQIDSYNESLMAVSEVQETEYSIKLYGLDKVKTIYISRKNLYETRWPDMPYQFRLGKNFVVLGSLKPDFKFPFRLDIYGFDGKFKGKLMFKDDENNQLIDIAGDKVVAFNPTKGTVSIYSIEVK